MSITPRTLSLWPDGCPHNGDGSDRPRIEIYEPSPRDVKPAAAIVVLPGGGYGRRADHEGAPFAELFASHGIVGIVCHYRVAPNRHPAPFTDAARSIRLVRAMADELHINPQRVGLMGFSAGGHNAVTVATQPDLHHDPYDELADRLAARPDRLILGYAVNSFVNHAHLGSAKNLLGPDPAPRVLEGLSGERHVTADTPPTFLFHTADDGAVPVENSLNFAAACREAGVPVELHVYQHGPHGVGMALDDPALRSWTTLMMDWLADWSA
jgi:acetyl esterase/lipase